MLLSLCFVHRCLILPFGFVDGYRVACTPDIRGRTPLQLASEEGASTMIVNALQGLQEPPNTDNNAPARTTEPSTPSRTFILSDPVMMEHISMATGRETLE